MANGLVAGASITAIAGVIGFATVALGSWYTVGEGERGVTTRNGAVTGVAQPGLGFKLPLVDGVYKISVQDKSRLYENVPSYSRDQQPANIAISVSYKIPADKVVEVFSDYGGEEGLLTRLVDRKVYEQLKNVFGQFNAVTAIQERSRLNAEVEAAVREGVGDGPVEIVGVQIENIDFSDAYENSIEQRMLAEVEVQRRRQEAEREKVQAEITVTIAQAEADAIRAKAEAQAQATRLTGEAEADAIAAKGAALRDNPTLIQLISAERWNGTLPTTMVPEASVPFVNVR